MPVRKYRSVEEMEDTFWVPPGTPEHDRAIRLVLEIAAFIAPRRLLPRGVFRFRSLEESQACQDVWERPERGSPPTGH